MIGVVKAFDRTPLMELPGDDAAALETKLATAARLFADRGARLNLFQYDRHRRLADASADRDIRQEELSS